MEKKLLLIILAVLLLIVSVPALAAYEFEQLPNGNFQVTFTYQSTADEVYLAGGFNDWNSKDPEYEMGKNLDGLYEITITLSKGNYEYKFVVDGSWKADPDNPEKTEGYGNSLLTVSSGSMLGEMGISGEMINELYREGEDGPVAMNNDLKIKMEGTIQQTIDENEVDRFDYMAEIKAENDLDDVENASSDADYLSIDEIYISKLNLTLLNDYANVSLQGNIDDNTDSFDYLGLVDATTDGDDRDYTKNVNDAGDNRRIKVTPGDKIPGDYDFYVNMTEYTGDITDSSSVKKYFDHINFKKDLKDPVTGLIKGQVGFTGLAYQPVVAGNIKEQATTLAVFGEYEVAKNLTVRGEYAQIPLGDMAERISGAFDKGDYWLFIFDVSEYPDIEDIKDPYSIEEVHIVGKFKEEAGEWDPADKTFAMEEVSDGYWELLVPKTAIDAGAGYKFIFDSDSWNGHECGDIDSDGDFEVGNNGRDILPLKNGKMYMTEVNYKIFDTRRSFKTSGDFYNFNVTAGYEVLGNGAYLPVGKDRLSMDTDIGHNRVYLHTYYYPLAKEDLKLTFDGYYQTGYDDLDTDINESDELSANVITPGFDYPQLVKGIEYIKGHVNFGKTEGKIVVPDESGKPKTLYYEWDEDRYKGFEDIRTIFIEGKTEPVGPFNYFLASVNNEKNLKVNDEDKFESVTEILTETELDIPVEQIAYIKGNVDYKLNDETGGEQRQPRYWVETKFHHIPELQDYITHILVNYESDVDGVIDESIYNDDDNDWQKKLYAETKFIIPDVENFDIKVSLESQYLEADIYPDIDDLDENLNAQYVVEGKNIDWYTFTTISTGYSFDYGIRADLSFKYDLNHGEISEYEDDAIKLQLSKPVNDFTTLKASYNSKHPDHSSEQFVNVMLETLF